ncbi:MAG TPA: hypothetical protein VKA15_12080, partial [Isosphaeraceae bacterium]|nr:hypothetical protein [Isosphaeraceae bacterium]
RTVAVAFSPDGSLLATGGSDQEVKLWMVKDGRLLRVMKGHGDEIVSLAYSPDGRWIASVGRDNTARLWEAATGREAWNHSGVVQLPDDRKGNGLAFSPDGQILAAASDDNTVPIWSVATGEPVRVLRGHTNQVNAVAFLSPTRIVTSSEDATIKLWDTHTGEDVFTLRGHIKGVLGVACRPDGQEIASVSVDGTARIWDASVPTLDLSLRREAADVVDRLYSVHHLKDDVVQVLRQLPVLDGPVRELALQLAQKRTENPSALNNASWLIVQKSGQAIEEYRRALRYAEAACKLVPEDGPTANTLGVARYRAGQYREAIPDLERSIRLNAPQFGGPTPADLAFLAMSHQKLGQTAEALKTIEKLRALMARKPWSTDDESKVFFQEAVSLIQTSGTKQP